MIDFLKKSFFTTIGIVYLSKEKVQEIGKKYIEETNLSEEEGKKFYNELIKKTEDARLAFEKVMNEKIEIILKKLEIPTRSEIDVLKKQIEELEGKVINDE